MDEKNNREGKRNLIYYGMFIVSWKLISKPSEQSCEILAKFRQFLANERRIRQKCAKKNAKNTWNREIWETLRIRKYKAKKTWTKIDENAFFLRKFLLLKIENSPKESEKEIMRNCTKSQKLLKVVKSH